MYLKGMTARPEMKTKMRTEMCLLTPSSRNTLLPQSSGHTHVNKASSLNTQMTTKIFRPKFSTFTNPHMEIHPILGRVI